MALTCILLEYFYMVLSMRLRLRLDRDYLGKRNQQKIITIYSTVPRILYGKEGIWVRKVDWPFDR